MTSSFPLRYGIEYEALDKDSYLCASCQGHCNCSLCLGRKGYRGRVDAFRGVSIRNLLSAAINGTDFTCIKQLLDSKVEEAGGLSVWITIEGSSDMAEMLAQSEERMLAARENKGRRTDRPEDSKRTPRSRGQSTPAVGARVLLEDGVELDLATILLGLVPGNGKGKTIDS